MSAIAEPMDRCWRCFHQLLDLGPGGICAKPIDPMGIERPCACPLFVVGPPDKGVCRSCGAGIVWWRTRYGKAVPCDPDGVNHFVTCPNRDRHRKKRPAPATVQVVK